jgi:hypothetical protein
MSTQPKDFEPEFEKDAWWWRRLVFAEFVKPVAAAGERAAHEYETVRPSRKHTETILTCVRRADFRRGLEQMGSSEFSQWKDGMERAAYNYELLRRHPDFEELRKLPSWPETSIAQFSWFAGCLRKQSRPIFKKQCSSDRDRTYSATLDFQWDLTRTDKALCDQFLLLIHQERKKNGLIGEKVAEYSRVKGKLKLFDLNPQKNANKDKRKERPVSWRTVELLDLESKRELDYNEEKAVKQTLRRLETDLIEGFRNSVKNAANDSSELPPSTGFDHGRNPIWRWLMENLPIWEQSLPN